MLARCFQQGEAADAGADVGADRRSWPHAVYGAVVDGADGGFQLIAQMRSGLADRDVLDRQVGAQIFDNTLVGATSGAGAFERDDGAITQCNDGLDVEKRAEDALRLADSAAAL